MLPRPMEKLTESIQSRNPTLCLQVFRIVKQCELQSVHKHQALSTPCSFFPRLFEDWLSVKILLSCLGTRFQYSVLVSVATFGPRSRRVCVFQAFRSLFRFSMSSLFGMHFLIFSFKNSLNLK